MTPGWSSTALRTFALLAIVLAALGILIGSYQQGEAPTVVVAKGLVVIAIALLSSGAIRRLGR
jgi:hypothetical protein